MRVIYNLAQATNDLEDPTTSFITTFLIEVMTRDHCAHALIDIEFVHA